MVKRTFRQMYASGVLPYWAFAAMRNVYSIWKNNPCRAIEWGAANRAFFEDAVAAGCRVFLLNTPEHGNLGDLAIAEATRAFLSSVLPEGEMVTEVGALSEHIFSLKILRKIIPETALILFQGGGYIGTDWPNGEEAFRRTVLAFPKNRIIMMPQSFHYPDDAEGRTAVKRSVRDLSAHDDLHIFARETITYEFIQQHYAKAKVYLSPDMALSFGPDFTAAYGETNRNGILLCMRSDKEKLLTESDMVYIEKVCGEYGPSAYTDNFCPEEYTGPINAQTRGALVDAKLRQCSGAKLIVTDRLHGMIFSALTGTPCVALGCTNQKIEGTAKWLGHLGFVRYITQVSDLKDAIDAVLAHGPGRFDNSVLMPHYDELSTLLMEKY